MKGASGVLKKEKKKKKPLRRRVEDNDMKMKVVKGPVVSNKQRLCVLRCRFDVAYFKDLDFLFTILLTSI